MRLAAVFAAALLAGRGLAADDAPAAYTPEQVKAVVEQHVARRTAEGGGVYRLADERTGRQAELEFLHVGVVGAAATWAIHDPNRKPTAQGYSACVRFHPVGAPPEEVYDVDLAVEPGASGLAVTGEHLHKVTRLEGGRWVWREASPAAKAAR